MEAPSTLFASFKDLPGLQRTQLLEDHWLDEPGLIRELEAQGVTYNSAQGMQIAIAVVGIMEALDHIFQDPGNETAVQLSLEYQILRHEDRCFGGVLPELPIINMVTLDNIVNGPRANTIIRLIRGTGRSPDRDAVRTVQRFVNAALARLLR